MTGTPLDDDMVAARDVVGTMRDDALGIGRVARAWVETMESEHCAWLFVSITHIWPLAQHNCALAPQTGPTHCLLTSRELPRGEMSFTAVFGTRMLSS
jgi:hypothetical protein